MYEYLVVSCFASARYFFFCDSLMLLSSDFESASLQSMTLNSMILVKSLLMSDGTLLRRALKCEMADFHLLSQNSSSARLKRTLGSFSVAIKAFLNIALALRKSLNST